MDILENITLPVRDGSDLDDLAFVFGYRVTRELAEGSLFPPHVGKNSSFDDHFRVGRNEDWHSLTPRHAQRFVHHPANNRVFVFRRRRERLRA